MVSITLDRSPLGLVQPPEMIRRPAFLTRFSEKPKAVTPEAVKAVGVRLNERLVALKTDFTKLGDDLTKGNCIRLDRLNFDYSAEIERYGKAVAALSNGNTELARNLLEQQVCNNLVQMEEMTGMVQKENAGHAILTGDISRTKKRLKVSIVDKMRLSNFEAVQLELYKSIGDEVDKEHPEWQKLEKKEYLNRKDAEIRRYYNLRKLYSPRAMAEYTKTALDTNAKISHRVLYVQLRYAEMQALNEHRSNLTNPIGAREQMELVNMEIDGEIQSIGGKRIGDPDRLKERQKKAASMREGRRENAGKSLKLIMEDENGELKGADGKMVATAQMLTQEQARLDQELLHVKDKVESRRINQTRSRITMIQNSLQQIWDKAREMYKSHESIPLVDTFPLKTLAGLRESGAINFALPQGMALSPA